MKIGITGSKGFIGSNVAKYFSREEIETISLDKYTYKNNFIESKVYRLPSNLKWVLHFAAETSIEKSFKNPFEVYFNNLQSTLTALRIAYNTKAAFLFMSSYVYGRPQYTSVDETHPVDFTNPYIGSKIIGEHICLHFSKILSIPLVILRGSNIYGDCNVKGRLVSDTIKAIRNSEPIILNNPAPKRDYLYIEDFIALIKKIVLKKPVITGIFNVGYGASHSNLEVVKTANKIAGNKYKIIIKNEPRSNDILNCSMNVNLIKRKFLWEPMYNLEEGLAELIKSNPDGRRG